MPGGAKSLILLRDSETGEFYQHPGKWIASRAHATVFETQERAIQTRAQVSKAKVEMFVIDESGKPRMGLRLWKGHDDPATNKQPGGASADITTPLL